MRNSISERVITVATILLSVMLAIVWLWRMPIFQAMDEQGHADYAYELFDVGAPFKVRDPRFADSTTNQVRYLESRLNFFALRRIPAARVLPNYGSAQFFHCIDEEAPRPSKLSPRDGSAVSHYAQNYPAGFYAITAIVMWFGYTLSHGSLIASLYAARSVAVVALIFGLVGYAGSLSQLSLAFRVRAIALAGIAMLPILDWVCSYVQPDALVFATVSLTFWAFLRWRSRPSLPTTLILATVAAATFFVKVHYGAIVAIPVVASMIGEGLFHRAGVRERAFSAGFVAITALAAALVAPHFGLVAHMTPPPPRAPSAAQPRPVTIAATIADYAFDDVRSIFFGGEVFQGFWNRFGDLPAPYIDERNAPGYILFAIIGLLSAGSFISMVVRQAIVAKALVRLASHRPRLALALAIRDPLLLSYILWVTFLCIVDAVTDREIFTEGRYFVPMLLPTVLIGIYYLPRLAPRRQRLRFASIAAFAWLLGGCTLAPMALHALQHRYYEQPSATDNDTFALVRSVIDQRGRRLDSRVVRLRPGSRLTVSGVVGSLSSKVRLIASVAGGPLTETPLKLGQPHPFRGVENAYPFTFAFSPTAGEYEIDITVRDSSGAFADDWLYLHIGGPLVSEHSKLNACNTRSTGSFDASVKCKTPAAENRLGEARIGSTRWS